MGYCNRAQIVSRRLPEKRIIELCDDEHIGADNEEIPTRINDVLKDVDGEINDYLIEGGYNLPLPSIPDSLVTIAVDMSVYGLHGRRDGDKPEDVADRYTRAVARLKQYRDSMKKGKDILFPVQVVVVEDAPVVLVNKTVSDAEFSPSRLNQML